MSLQPIPKPQIPKPPRKRRILRKLILLVLLIAIGVTIHVYSPGPLTENKVVVVQPGTSVGGIAIQLANNGVIREPVVFYALIRVMHPKGLQAGEYSFKPGENLSSVIYRLHKGSSVQRFVTIPEGLTAREIVQILNSEANLGGVVTTMPAEGTMLPETYRYVFGENRGALVERMQAAMKKTLDELWDRREILPQLRTPEEAVILASIVEKETAVPSERTTVAGVFLNRLRMGMPLQSDPTVIYALTEGKRDLGRLLTRADWATNSPYNTYLIAGLPPKPIANPGRASLLAVMHPASHNYLYFVADGKGGHVFSATLAEHNINVAKWQKLNAPAKKAEPVKAAPAKAPIKKAVKKTTTTKKPATKKAN